MTQLLWNIRNEFSQTLERWWWHLFWLQILISLPIWAKWPFFGSFFHANGVFGIWLPLTPKFYINWVWLLIPPNPMSACSVAHVQRKSTKYPAMPMLLMRRMSASETFACAPQALCLCHTGTPPISLSACPGCLMHFFFCFPLIRPAKVIVIQQCSVFKVLPFSLNHINYFT